MAAGRSGQEIVSGTRSKTESIPPQAFLGGGQHASSKVSSPSLGRLGGGIRGGAETVLQKGSPFTEHLETDLVAEARAHDRPDIAEAVNQPQFDGLGAGPECAAE